MQLPQGSNPVAASGKPHGMGLISESDTDDLDLKWLRKLLIHIRNCDSSAQQIREQIRQPIVMAFRRTVADNDVLSVVKTRFSEALADAVQRLSDISGIAIVYLDEHDIVRHPLVQQVVRAYEEDKPRRKKE